MTIFEEISPVPDQGLAAVYAKLDEGLLFASNLNENYKHTLIQIAALPAFAAAGALGAYNTRMASLKEFNPDDHDDAPAEPEPPASDEDKEIPEKSIRLNLQQIASAAQTYFIDNPEVNNVSYEQLIKAELIEAFDSISGEKYQSLTLKRTGGTLTVSDDKKETTKFKYSAVTD